MSEKKYDLFISHASEDKDDIVQPGVSKAKASDEILTLLGVTDSFLKETTGIDLQVITS